MAEWTIKLWEELSREMMTKSMRMDRFPALKKGKNTKQAERYPKVKCDFPIMMKYHKDPFKISPEGMVDSVSVFNVIDIDENEDIDIG